MNYLGDVDVLLANTKLNVGVSLRSENLQLISHEDQPALLITEQPPVYNILIKATDNVVNLGHAG